MAKYSTEFKMKVVKKYLEKSTIEKYIKYYNEERIKEKLGYLSPIEYRELNEK